MTTKEEHMQLGRAPQTPRRADLPQTIKQQIMNRTFGRIHRLEVEVTEDRVVVHGRSSSYYSKQLALEGALEVIGPRGTQHVELDVQVTSRPRAPSKKE
jgi:hypothetical protein